MTDPLLPMPLPALDNPNPPLPAAPVGRCRFCKCTLHDPGAIAWSLCDECLDTAEFE